MAEMDTDKAAGSGTDSVVDLAEEIRKTNSSPLPGAELGTGAKAAPGGEHRKVSQEEKAAALAGIGELLALGGDVMHAVTDKDRWIITPKEKELLEKKAGPALTAMLDASPEQITKQMFYYVLAVIYGPRIIAEVKDLIIEMRKPKA